MSQTVPESGLQKPRKPRKSPVNDLTTARARQHDIEQKRSRGEIACLDCSRLKLRCDKKIPCSACIRRACDARCPNGVSTGSGNSSKYVLLDSEILEAKADKMADRIRQLEDALAISHSIISSNPHPLLVEEFRTRKSVFTNDRQSAEETERSGDEPVDDIGLLTISGSGAARFTGRSGGDEALLVDAMNKRPTTNTEIRHPRSTMFFPAPPPIWPFTRLQAGAVEQLRHHIPTKERTIEICGRYLEQSMWHIRFIRRWEVFEEVIPYIFGESLPPGSPVPKGSTEVAHTHALLFMLLSLGTMAQALDSSNHESVDKFYQCARCLINLDSIADSPTLTTVQVLGLMGMFISSYDKKSNMELGRALLNLASSLSVAIGLHRDPGRWDLDPRTMERRREVFWQLQTVQNWHGIVSGRPGPYSLKFADCRFPTEEREEDAHGNDIAEFWLWRYRFIKEVLHPVHQLVCSTGSLKYSDVMALDRKLREFDLPEWLKPSAITDQDVGMYAIVKKFLPVMWNNAALLLLHRMFFTKAMLDHPSDPLQSKYSPSFLSAYRTSLSALKYAREYFKYYPRMLKRSWMVWKHSFSALIILGTVVARGTSSIFAPPAFVEFTMGMKLLEQVAKEAQWARKYLGVLRPLRERAYEAYACHRNGEMPNDAEGEKEVERQITIFGGHTLSLSTEDTGENKTPAPISPLMPHSSPAAQPNVQSYFAQAGFSPLSEPWPPISKRTTTQMTTGGSGVQQQTTGLPNLFDVPSNLRTVNSNYEIGLGLPAPPQTSQPIDVDRMPVDLESLFQQSDWDSILQQSIPLNEMVIPNYPLSSNYSLESGGDSITAINRGNDMMVDEGWSAFMEELGLVQTNGSAAADT